MLTTWFPRPRAKVPLPWDGKDGDIIPTSPRPPPRGCRAPGEALPVPRDGHLIFFSPRGGKGDPGDPQGIARPLAGGGDGAQGPARAPTAALPPRCCQRHQPPTCGGARAGGAAALERLCFGRPPGPSGVSGGFTFMAAPPGPAVLTAAHPPPFSAGHGAASETSSRYPSLPAARAPPHRSSC
ncbi:collagen alpha-1(III) chain-like [Monodelphis domestica]|uniref:collagen alpha-1(III) chain-like n=1 Tax=Monodelphis domestica TaxID=13616 RepID=UPI0024E1CCCD|nr:collagen alpha-1(III) chain-like [Monodelphis domestica]